jgi:5-methylcytosine-specific restriction endonuclease McrA
MTWVERFRHYAPIGSVVQELVRFDLQKHENPEVKGVQYQQGTLAGYETREYLLNKWDRKCTYCKKEGVPLQIEHIHPKAKGGSDRISNLCLACEPCNIKKGTQDVEQFLAKKPDLLKQIKAQQKRPLKDAAAVNSTRWALFNRLSDTGLPVKTGSGGLTKFNRTRFELPKAHWLDAACAGVMDSIKVLIDQPLLIKATGHGSRQMVQNDKFGFPRKGYKAKQRVIGWKTGDIVSVVSGKFAGLKGKRLKTVRFKGSFDIRLSPELIIKVNRNDLKAIHQNDGYGYA